MASNSARLIAGILLIATLLAGCDTARQVLTEPGDEAAAPQGGYTATGAELTATDAAGLPRYTLQAGSIEQEPGKDPVKLVDVTLNFPDSRAQRWVLTAADGTMSTTARDQPAIIDLHGNVRLQTEGGRTGSLTLETETLRFDTAKNLASTDQFVTLRSGPRTLEARGMSVDLGTRLLRLESDVHARVRP